MSKLRIAFILLDFPAISETFILNQITGLIDLGHDVDIYALRKVKGPHHADVEEYQILKRTQYINRPTTIMGRAIKLAGLVLKTIFRHPVFIFKEFCMFDGGFGWHSENIEIMQRLNSSCKNKPYDIIHCHYGTVARQFLPAISLLRVKYVVSFYGYDLFHYGDRGKAAYRGLFKIASGIIANTNYSAGILTALGCPREKISILPSALKLDKFTLRPRGLEPGNTIKLLTVARLVEVKGIEYPIGAVAKLADRYPIQYQIVGEGQERTKLEGLVKALGLGDIVFLLGELRQEEVIGLMDEAHIFVLVSITSKTGQQDNGPNVLKEAQASGMPVVSSNSGAIPEVVQNGVSGFLVPECDVDALADRLEYLINHPEIWSEMGKSGRSFVEANFHIKKVSERCENIYQTLLKK